ncbi:transmembrane protein 230 [Episyrphus balteatus]|uniref:transmembrane protein 230 n=1 Tax=Episyrphus balteatus TaxID=286459 RepID=UPI0024865514|nr:transmembrane protein 230 [Episyrphus balteatus]XP_055837232.1 transmembrane protein 230 [Episyrphus balteatus]XP_055837233.1 transmembrane protein 230 [Episyrphus balteatus]
MTTAGSVHHRGRKNVNRGDYTRIIDPSTHDTADGISADQFDVEPERKIPWKQMFLITGFMIFGGISITLSILISAGYFDAKYEDRVWPLLMLGILMFIPGGYYGYILICILFKKDGFTYEDIPIF